MALNPIFRYMIAPEVCSQEEKTSYLANTQWFVSSIPITEFREIDYYMTYILSKTAELNLVISRSSLRDFTRLYIKEAIAASGVKIQGMEMLNLADPVDLEKAYVFVSEALNLDVELLFSLEPVVAHDFPEAAKQFFEEQMQIRAVDIYTKSMQIAGPGYKKMQGAQASIDYATARLEEVKYVYSPEKIEMLASSSPVEFIPKQLVKTGIEALDADTLGLYEGQLWGIEAGSGVGKTRFALGVFTYNAMLSGLNVCYFAMEQSKREIEAMLIARHLYEVYGHHIEDKLIYRNLVPMELQEEVAAVEYDLLKSGKYGKLYVRNGILYDNDIDKVLSSIHTFHGPFQLFVIDHMYLLEHQVTKYEPYSDRHTIIANGYRKLKRFVQNKRYAVLAVNQLNKTGMEYVAKDKCPPQDGAAGGIEVYRNTDYNMVLAQTDAMSAQRKMRIFIPKVRSSSGDISPLLDVCKWNCVFKTATQSAI